MPTDPSPAARTSRRRHRPHRAVAAVAVPLLAGAVAASGPVAAPDAPPPATPTASTPDAVLPDDVLERARQTLAASATIAIGTAHHGDLEMDRAVVELIRGLVERDGVRLVALETAIGIEDVLQHGGAIPESGAAVEPELAYLLRPHRTDAVLDLLRFLRTWNLDHPDNPVRLVGLQPESPRRNLRILRETLGANDGISPTDAAIPLALLERELGPVADGDLALSIERTRRLRRRTAFLPGTKPASLLQALARLDGLMAEARLDLVERDGEERVIETRLALEALRTWIETIDRLETRLVLGQFETPEDATALRHAAHNAIAEFRRRVFEIWQRRLGLDAPGGHARGVLWTKAFSANWRSAKTSIDHPFGPPLGVASVTAYLRADGRAPRTLLVARAIAPTDGADDAGTAKSLPARLAPLFTAGDADDPVLLERVVDGDRLARLGLDAPLDLPIDPAPGAAVVRGLVATDFSAILALPPAPPEPGPGPTDPSRVPVPAPGAPGG